MVKKNRKEKIRDLAKSYEPTPQERAALEAYRIQEEVSCFRWPETYLSEGNASSG
jgi:hypothetical protein